MKKYIIFLVLVILCLVTFLFMNTTKPIEKISTYSKKQQQPKITTNAYLTKKPVVQKNMALYPPILTFENFEKKFNEQMPNKSILKKLKHMDAHHSHPYLKEATNLLLDAIDYFNENKTIKEKQLEFYLSCTEKEEFFNSIRATCLSNANKLYLELTGEKLPLDFFDAQVATISDELE